MLYRWMQNLIKGSHGRIGAEPEYHPVLITDQKQEGSSISANQVVNVILSSLRKKDTDSC